MRPDAYWIVRQGNTDQRDKRASRISRVIWYGQSGLINNGYRAVILSDK